MVTRKRTKPETRKGPSLKLKGILQKGDWLDVMDGDGVWNVARVLSVPSPYEVEITYDGWPKDYDEVVQVDSDRVAPYHTFTWTVKCWVKYLNWPLWPSLVTIRTPGTELGIRNLAAENRLHIDFLDHSNFDKRDRCWQPKRQVRTFENDYDNKRTGSTGAQFEQALGWVLQADAPTKLPKFAAGTLPESYAHNTAKSVKEVRNEMGEELWFQSFKNNRMRHQMTHVYETINDEEESSRDDSSSEVAEKESSLATTEKEPQILLSEKMRPSPVEIEPESSLDVEVPYELVPLNSSVSEDDEETARTKRKRLRTKPKKDIPTEKRLTAPAPTFVRARTRVSRRKSQPKGQIKMTASRSYPPAGGILNLTAGDLPIAIYAPDENGQEEYEADNSRDAATSKLQTDTDSKRLATNQHTETSRVSDAAPRKSIEAEIELAKKKLQALEEKKLRATDDTVVRGERVRLSDPSPMLAGSQGRSQPISPRVNTVEPHRSKRVSSTVSRHTKEAGDVLKRQPLSTMKKSGKGMVRKSSSDLHSQPEKLARFILPDDSSGSSEKSKRTIQDQVEITTKIMKRVENAGSKSLEVSDTLVEPPNQLSVSTNDTELEETQESHRPYSVMQAQNDDDQLPIVDAEETVKVSTKITFSVPRKFNETFRAPHSSSNSMLRIASPPQPFSSNALASASTAMFSSSEGFSLEGWFRRKVMRNFINGGSG